LPKLSRFAVLQSTYKGRTQRVPEDKMASPVRQESPSKEGKSKSVRDLRSEPSKVSEYVLENVKNMYFANIPMDSIKETPLAYKLTMGTIAYIVFVSLMALFIDQSYESAITQPYMSLQNGPLCSAVPLLLSGNYQADSNGNWVGASDYSYVRSLYEISLSWFDLGFTEFQVGEIAQSQDLAINLVYWMNYYTSISVGTVSSMEFQFSGSPSQVFNLDYYHAAVASVTGTCAAPAIASYDVSTATLAMQYNYSIYSKATYCAASLNPFIAGYYPILQGATYTLELDMNAFSTAVAVNLGILPLDLLQTIPGKDISSVLDGFVVEFAEYFDPRTPEMESIICLKNVTSLDGTPTTTQARGFLSGYKDFCMMKFSSSLMIPTFNHAGASLSEPKQCSCSNGVGYSAACQEFNLLPSLLFYNVPGNTSISSVAQAEQIEAYQLVRLLLLINSTSYTALNNDAYNISFATIGSIYPGMKS
jgi:hypothetical protein